jgi:hypothetical protein
MPPVPPHTPETNTDHLLERKNPSSGGSGPIVGIIIIVLMLILGGLYFWGAQLNRTTQPLPLIPGDSTAN